MRIKIRHEKTYGEIIPLHKSDVILGERMGSMDIREAKGTKQQEILMGKTEYNEVEVENNNKHEQRQAKWHNAFQASGGEIYVFCDNRSCMRSIRSEINFSLGRQTGQCSLTKLADHQAGKRATDGGIWLDVRQNRSFS
jgi:hypothetical protein